jgi:O-antigen/teichoic acid export membrane protein
MGTATDTVATKVASGATHAESAPCFGPSARTLMRPLAKAMTKTGAAAMGSALLGALAAKILASVGGPQAIAVFASLQQTRQAAVIAATANGQTALVQGASSLQDREKREYIRTVAWIVLFSTLATGFLLTLAPGWLIAFTAIPASAVPAIPRLAIGVALLSAFTFATALLAAGGAIGRLAESQVAGSSALAVGAWPAAKTMAGGKPDVLAHLLNFSAAASAGTGLWAVWRSRAELKDWVLGSGRLWSSRAARLFFSMSGAMLVSGLTASATLLAVRARIIETQGAVVTGQFDAAWAISMSHATLVLSSVQSYYLPALSRAHLTSARAEQVSAVLTISALVAAVIIAALAILKPWALSALYAPAFRPGAWFLRWTLIGDYLKVASWIFSIPILARGDMKTFLAADLAAYATFAGAAVVLGNWAGAAQGAAMAFVAMYAVHLAVCAVVVRWGYGITIRNSAWGTLAAGAFLVGVVTAFTWNQV